MERKSFLLFLGAGKRSRGILFLCMIVVALLVVISVAIWNVPASSSATVSQTLNISTDKITRIDISNGSGPVAKVTDRNDITQLLNPFMKIKIWKASAFKASVLNQQMHGRAGAEGLYYVIYKDGLPYVHMEFFKPKLFNICPNEQAKNKTFYSSSNDVNATSINTILAKYHINGI